jgi:HJR/Mrr/RecB family endonuclease
MSPEELYDTAVERFQSDEAATVELVDLMMAYAQEMAAILVETLNVPSLSLPEFEALLGLRGSGEGERTGCPLWSDSVRVVTLDIAQLLRCVELDPAELLHFSPRRFEELIADIWKRFGYEVELTKTSRDGGRDIIATRNDEVRVKVLIECKRYTPPRKVGAPVVQQLYGVLMTEGATKAVVATTAEFSRDAEKIAKTHPWHIDLRDKCGIVDWLRRADRKLFS